MAKSKKDLFEKLSCCPDYKDQVKILREALGITQEQLAKRVDRTPRSIRTIEKGEAFPRISTLQKIAEALDAELKISLIPRGKTDITGVPGEETVPGAVGAAVQGCGHTGPVDVEGPVVCLDEKDERKGFIIGETD